MISRSIWAAWCVGMCGAECVCVCFQNDDFETDIAKLRPRQGQTRPFDELRVYERFFLELSEDFQVGLPEQANSSLTILSVTE